MELLGHDDMPLALRRPHILGGYRPNPFACSLCEGCRSMRYVHNESGNVWTHAAGALLFAGLALAGSAPGDADWLRLAFLAAACCMTACSAAYHMLRYTGHRAFEATYACDLGGTLLTIVATTNWLVSLGFRCHPRLRAVYLAAHNLVALPLLVAVPRLSAGAALGADRWGAVKPLFVGLAASGLLPLAHGAALVGAAQPGLVAGAGAMMAIYGAGVAALFTGWPESAHPGRFDLWCSSHQIWHVAVVLAALSGYAGGVDATRRLAAAGCA